ncbi:MAG: hypothetical protein JW718_08735 [Desulfovibrionaceae bacterium]|nr:hypothetical protein [Desulfovibrionaceae bacterium]
MANNAPALPNPLSTEKRFRDSLAAGLLDKAIMVYRELKINPAKAEA